MRQSEHFCMDKYLAVYEEFSVVSARVHEASILSNERPQLPDICLSVPRGHAWKGLLRGHISTMSKPCSKVQYCHTLQLQ